MPFLPTKLLPITMSGTEPSAYFASDDGWQGYPYQWTTNLSVTALPHGSKYTREPYFYNGLDVGIGDSISTGGLGRCLKIVSIQSATETEVACTVEDYNRENIMSDMTQSGDGSISDGDGYLFEVTNGFPILHPIPESLAGVLPPYFSADIITRFLNNLGNNSKLMYINQTAHGFSVGDPVYLWQDLYYKANASDIDYGHVDGVVVATGIPDANRFGMLPTGILVEGVTMPAGDSGTVVYMDVYGNLTTTKPTTGIVVPMYTKINATSGFYIGGMAGGAPTANSTNYDNTTQQFPGTVNTVQEALDAVTQYPVAPKTQYMSGYSGYSGVVAADTEVIIADWDTYAGTDQYSDMIVLPAATGSGRVIRVACCANNGGDSAHTPFVDTLDASAPLINSDGQPGFTSAQYVPITTFSSFTDSIAPTHGSAYWLATMNYGLSNNYPSVQTVIAPGYWTYDQYWAAFSGYSGYSGGTYPSHFSGYSGNLLASTQIVRYRCDYSYSTVPDGFFYLPRATGSGRKVTFIQMKNVDGMANYASRCPTIATSYPGDIIILDGQQAYPNNMTYYTEIIDTDRGVWTKQSY